MRQYATIYGESVNGLIGLCGTLLFLLLVGGLIGILNRRHFAPRWLLIAALLVAINDALLTRVYGTMPDLLPDSDWNWQGKLLTLAATLAIGALPMFGWRRVGLTLAQAPGSLKAALPRSEEHTSELQSLMRISYAVFCLKKKNTKSISTIKRKHDNIHNILTEATTHISSDLYTIQQLPYAMTIDTKITHKTHPYSSNRLSPQMTTYTITTSTLALH